MLYYSRLPDLLFVFQCKIYTLILFLSSIEFDRDDELFATAGVSRCIKVFDFSSVSFFTLCLFLSFLILVMRDMLKWSL